MHSMFLEYQGVKVGSAPITWDTDTVVRGDRLGGYYFRTVTVRCDGQLGRGS